MKAEKGNKVKVHYKGTLEDGTLFDSSEGREPLEFEVGAGQMIKGFDAAVNGMVVGDKKDVNIPAAEAYGDVNKELVYRFPKDQVPPDLKAEVGTRLAVNSQDGQSIPVKVIEVTDAEIVLDANHELAGKDLNFNIELVEIA